MTDITLGLRGSFLSLYPDQAADALEDLPEDDLIRELAGVDAASLVGVMEKLSTGRALAVFSLLDDARRTELLERGSRRLALVWLTALNEVERGEMLGKLSDAAREDLTRLVAFDENSAGRLMDRPLEAIRSDMTVAEALAVVRHSRFERLRSVFVVDDGNRLVGKVHMQALALARPEQRLSELTVLPDGVVAIDAKREEIVEQLDTYRVDSVPVVDLEGRLVGVVRYQQLFETIENVATADLQKMVGGSADERALSDAGFAVRKRLPWLHVNLLTAFLAAAVVGLFESIIAQFTALAVLLPVVAGQSGNAGSQALAVTIRGLALKEIGIRDWSVLLNKEIRVGVIDGAALAVTCGLGVYLWSQSLGLSLVIGVAMVMSMVAAGISGALVPLVLTRLGQDPATASSIILTTVTDVAGFFSFLGTATLLSAML
ncbi:MAG TPA: magnesium transporter [Pseudomonadales bacterium]